MKSWRSLGLVGLLIKDTPTRRLHALSFPRGKFLQRPDNKMSADFQSKKFASCSNFLFFAIRDYCTECRFSLACLDKQTKTMSPSWQYPTLQPAHCRSTCQLSTFSEIAIHWSKFFFCQPRTRLFEMKIDIKRCSSQLTINKINGNIFLKKDNQ